VTVSSATPGATIHYTTDGTSPSSAVYAGPISVAASTTIRAIATKAGWSDSYIVMGSYTFNFGGLAAPTVSPGAGTYVGSVSVTLQAFPGATIRYTTNGTEPTSSSALYAGPIALAATTTLKAKAFQADWTPSATASTTYTLQVAAPSLSPGSGTYPIGQAITVTCPTPGATIRYTLDGTDPMTSDAFAPSGGSLFISVSSSSSKPEPRRAACS
jgi:hypothetical protein